MKCYSPEQVALLGTLIAIDLAKGKSDCEIFCLRSIASQISATLTTISCQKNCLDKLNDSQNKIV